MLEVRVRAPGLSDLGVAELASAEGRVLLTHDHGFGEKAVRLGLLPNGVILVASPPGITVEERLGRLLEVLGMHEETLAAAFTVIDGRGVRRRPL